MTKQKKRRRLKKRRPGFFLKNRFLLILLGVVGLAVFSLVLLARMEEQPQRPAVLPVIKPPVVKPPIDYTSKVHIEVEALLSTLSSEAGDIQRDLDHDPARYTVEGELPSSEMISGFQARLQQIPGDYTVQLREANSLTVEKSRQTLIVIYFIPPVPAVPAGPLVTIIMDDLGRSTYTAKILVSMPQLVTFSILPGELEAVSVAELAYAAGREVMLHVPMEPQGYPAVNPGRDALFVKDSDAEISRRFDLLLAKIPHVSGSNNHMGSRFTEDARALAPVMESLKEKGLFFIDSRTTGHSRVTEAAQRFGVPTMSRDVFLDNVAEVDAIAREIRRLEGKARRQGMAIGICHPYPETLEALRRELPGLVERGINIVPVSTLLQKQSLDQGS
jgi:polysaccharide deacetylase 2 family uncharacterized protein YibQ